MVHRRRIPSMDAETIRKGSTDGVGGLEFSKKGRFSTHSLPADLIHPGRTLDFGLRVNGRKREKDFLLLDGKVYEGK